VARKWGPGSLLEIARAVRKRELDALLIQYAPDLYLPSPFWIHALPAAMKLLAPGVPAIFSMHTVGVSTPASKVGVGFMIWAAPAILATNEEVTHLIGKFLPSMLRKTYEIPIGANIEPPPGGREEARRKVREETGLGAEGMILSHFGFYYPGKGVEQILEAAGKWKTEGRVFRLFMIGGRRENDGGFYPALQERAASLGLSEEVIWTGYVASGRVTEILLASDLFLAPYEGGVSSRRGSLMAALVHGLPVLSTPSKIETRYFREGENFAAVSFGDADALAAEGAALMDDPERRARLRAGADALAEVFSWPVIAGDTRDFLESVLAGKPMCETDRVA
jgi:glycosyltransferase involved in cell wall biosynthesis